MYQCFRCLRNTVGWLGDFDLSDYGIEGERVVHECKCGYCGADITYVVRFKDEEESTSD